MLEFFTRSIDFTTGIGHIITSRLYTDALEVFIRQCIEFRMADNAHNLVGPDNLLCPRYLQQC